MNATNAQDRARTVAAITLGCKVNQYDTEAMLECLERAGWRRTGASERADAYLVNTCTVTGTGDAKSLKTIRRLARTHPDAALVVCGCMAQRDAQALSGLPGVRLVLGVARRGEVAQLLETALAQCAPLVAVEPLRNAAFEALSVERHEGRTRAVMKIQEGCDRYCSYCIIPSVRGPVRSMSISAVAAEAVRLSQSGYREIVLTGIHLASYGRGTDATFLDAIRLVHDTPGVDRVRLGSLEPTVVTEAFAQALSNLPGLARQFHLSLQSGCDATLKRMNRRYTCEEYLEALKRLREAMPGCAITTDVICGFPGETDADFEESCRFCHEAGFARMHVFPYSRRAGTRADRMDDQVPEATARARAKKLIALGNQMERAYVSSLLGATVQVLFETGVDGECCEGYTGEYVRVRAPGRPGEMRCVRIVKTDGTLALGEPAEYHNGV